MQQLTHKLTRTLKLAFTSRTMCMRNSFSAYTQCKWNNNTSNNDKGKMVIWSKTENMRKNSWFLNYQQVFLHFVPKIVWMKELHTRAQATKFYRKNCIRISFYESSVEFLFLSTEQSKAIAEKLHFLSCCCSSLRLVRTLNCNIFSVLFRGTF